jgi:hypothetical protein
MRSTVQAHRSKAKCRLLKSLISQIKQNTRQNSKASVQSGEAMLTGLDELEANFIHLLNGYCRLDDMQKVAGTGHEAELAKLQSDLAALAADAPSRNERRVQRRIELVEKRAAMVKDAEANKKKFLAQIEMVEETLRYLRDQSVQVFEPEVISKQVTAVSEKMQTTRETMLEIEKMSAGADFTLQQTQNSGSTFDKLRLNATVRPSNCF